ncbi:MAG: hypothetical protein ABIQ65_15745 [Thermoanaerobaculia bacterium]
MPEYVFDVSIAAKLTIKVEAPDDDKAWELASLYFINDWENAGPLRLGDVLLEDAAPDSVLDASIIDIGESGWRRAKDDPNYDPEVDGEDG